MHRCEAQDAARQQKQIKKQVKAPNVKTNKIWQNSIIMLYLCECQRQYCRYCAIFITKEQNSQHFDTLR